jgi:hypothetical protein
MASKQNNTKNKKPTNLVENLKEISDAIHGIFNILQ